MMVVKQMIMVMKTILHWNEIIIIDKKSSSKPTLTIRKRDYKTKPHDHYHRYITHGLQAYTLIGRLEPYLF